MRRPPQLGQIARDLQENGSRCSWRHRSHRKRAKPPARGVTHAVPATVAAFLNTEGGDVLIGAAGRSIAGIEHDACQTDDAFVRHLTATVRAGLGDRAGTCIDPRVQIVQGRSVCVVSGHVAESDPRA
jgi:hypothetical protein